MSNLATVKPVKRLRAPGHALTLEWSGETGPESSSTGTCKCGWTESASNQREVEQEYRWHLGAVLGLRYEPGQGWLPQATPAAPVWHGAVSAPGRDRTWITADPSWYFVDDPGEVQAVDAVRATAAGQWDVPAYRVVVHEVRKQVG